MSDLKTKITELIDGNKVMMFSKTTCPFCKMAKAALDKHIKGDYKVMELDKVPQGVAIQDTLRQFSKVKTVPQVFVNRKFLGGGSDVDHLEKTGKLKEILA